MLTRAYHTGQRAAEMTRCYECGQLSDVTCAHPRKFGFHWCVSCLAQDGFHPCAQCGKLHGEDTAHEFMGRWICDNCKTPAQHVVTALRIAGDGRSLDQIIDDLKFTNIPAPTIEAAVYSLVNEGRLTAIRGCYYESDSEAAAVVRRWVAA